MKRGLGRGIDSMIPASTTTTNQAKPVSEEPRPYTEIDINQIDANSNQPRKRFDEDELKELTESIRQYGVIEPIILSKRGRRYEIIAGERRWRAAKKAGLAKIPAVVKELSDREIMEVSLIENIQRQDLNPIEEAKAYETLIKTYNLKQEEVADKVSRSRAAITNCMRLLKLDERVQKMVEEGMLSEGHARTLIPITDPDKQYDTAYKVFDSKLSVRDTEKLVKNALEDNAPDPNKKPEKTESEKRAFSELEDKLRSYVGNKVAIKSEKSGKGKITIDYSSLDDLERISDLIMKGNKQ